MKEIKLTCLNIDCPERKGGECTAGKKIDEWFESYDWRKELTKLMKTYRDDEDIYFPEDLWSLQDSIEKHIELILIKILANGKRAR